MTRGQLKVSYQVIAEVGTEKRVVAEPVITWYWSSAQVEVEAIPPSHPCGPDCPCWTKK